MTTKNADWKKDLSNALNSYNQKEGTRTVQQESCEQQFITNLSDYGKSVAMQTVNELIVFGTEYLSCRFGANGSKELRDAQLDFTQTVLGCAFSLTNLRLLFSGDWTAYISAVIKCVTEKLSS